jgi:hypothetical protein
VFRRSAPGASLLLLAFVAALRLGTGPAAAWLVERLAEAGEHHCHCPLNEHHCSCPLCTDDFVSRSRDGGGALEQGACAGARTHQGIVSRTPALCVRNDRLPDPLSFRPRRDWPAPPVLGPERSREPPTPPPRPV